MSGITYDYMEEYIRGLIKDREGTLKELEDYAKENAVPIVQKEVAKFLELMVAIKKPKNILEMGTAIGYSSILLASSSNTSECNVTTIERDPKMIELAKTNILKYGFKDKITIVEGDCLEVLEHLEGSFDMIFIDAGKGHYNHFLPHCLRLLSKDGVMIGDNVLFRGMVANKELVIRRKITIVKRMKNYLELISDDKKFITSILPMGDGIAVTVRRESENE